MPTKAKSTTGPYFTGPAGWLPPFLKNQRDLHAELEKPVLAEAHTKGKSIIGYRNIKKYLIQKKKLVIFTDFWN